MNRKSLVILTVCLALGLLVVVLFPAMNALAAKESRVSIVCEPGATVVTLDDGRVKVTGMCSVQDAPRVNDSEWEPIRLGEAEASESYVSPYPEPEPLDLCDGIWRALWFCEE